MIRSANKNIRRPRRLQHPYEHVFDQVKHNTLCQSHLSQAMPVAKVYLAFTCLLHINILIPSCKIYIIIIKQNIITICKRNVWMQNVLRNKLQVSLLQMTFLLIKIMQTTTLLRRRAMIIVNKIFLLIQLYQDDNTWVWNNSWHDYVRASHALTTLWMSHNEMTLTTRKVECQMNTKGTKINIVALQHISSLHYNRSKI